MSVHISITHSQAQHLVNQWNDLANSSCQLTYADAHLIMGGGNFDSDLIEYGVAPVEIKGAWSKTGNPVDLAVWASDVCIEEVAA